MTSCFVAFLLLVVVLLLFLYTLDKKNLTISALICLFSSSFFLFFFFCSKLNLQLLQKSETKMTASVMRQVALLYALHILVVLERR